ncbi:MAG: hypothetical protein ACM3IJ_04855 [Candidatus Levyibacteriota bacterium]
MANKKPINVKVRNTENILFEGEVERISSFNEVGPFDIYHTHANFISIINKQLDLYHDHKKVKTLQFEQAVLKVKKDAVHIFLGIESLFVDEELLSKKPTKLK